MSCVFGSCKPIKKCYTDVSDSQKIIIWLNASYKWKFVSMSENVVKIFPWYCDDYNVKLIQNHRHTVNVNIRNEKVLAKLKTIRKNSAGHNYYASAMLFIRIEKKI